MYKHFGTERVWEETCQAVDLVSGTVYIACQFEFTAGTLMVTERAFLTKTLEPLDVNTLHPYDQDSLFFEAKKLVEYHCRRLQEAAEQDYLAPYSLKLA